MAQTIAIENGEAVLTKSQRRKMDEAADILRGLQQVYFQHEGRRLLLSAVESVLRNRGVSEADGEKFLRFKKETKDGKATEEAESQD